MSSKLESEKYDICFVKSKEKEVDNENLKKAFNAMAAVELDPMWVSERSCLMIDKMEPKLFVMDPFEGKVYDHLKSLDCRIVGPLCILSCLERNETLPKRPHPVFSIAMRGITVSCSNMNTTLRGALGTKVELMGGNFSKDLTKSVTHLVVGEVGSKKYHVAASFGLTIMLPEWIQELWNSGQHNQIHGTDASYSKFKCPIFKGLSITVSQIGNDERMALKAAIEDNGGHYSGSLKSRQTTHLVLLEPHGDKYNFAKSWKLHCVKVDWLYDSVRLGYCMDEHLYPLDQSSAPKRSTPIKEKEGVKLSVDCSAINASIINQLDETAQNNEVSVILRSKQNSPLNEIDEFDISSLPKFGQFLDGCKIYLCGFKGKYLDKLRKIINFSGGMRFNKYSDSISHIVCYEKDEYLMDCIENSSSKPHIVTFHWLLECSKFQKIVDESPFILPELTSLTADQPEELIPCKDNSRMLNTDLSDAKVVTSNKDSSSTMLLSKELTLGGDFTEILKQYSTTGNNIPEETSISKGGNASPSAECNKSLHSVTERSPALNQRSVTIPHIGPIDQPINPINQPAPMDLVDDAIDDAKSDEDEMGSKLFMNTTFKVLGFGPQEIELLSNMVILNGGTIPETSSDIKADIAVVPIVWDNVEVDAQVVITNCWLQKCIEENVILSFDCDELFKPLNIVATKQPLKNLVISISQYTGTERDCLMHLVDVLGGSCQEYFVRKPNPSRGLKTNTHLVVCRPEGSKYEASKKWKVPAITKHWLLAAAKLDVVPPIENFLVELAQPETPIQLIEKSSKVVLDELDSKTNIEETTIQKSDVSFPNSNSKVTADGTKSKNHDGNKMDDDCDDVFIAPNNRVIELIDTERKFSPKTPPTSNRSSEPEGQTPRLHVSDLLAGFESSPDDFNDRTKRNPSLPLQEALTHNINVALHTVGYMGNNTALGNHAADGDNTEVKRNVLGDVIVCVSKKMNDLRGELKRIVLSLGGQFRWTYDQSCTHFVFQGKASDFTKDFREAKRQGMKIVSPGWIYACQEAQMYVSEDHYPPTVRSRLNLSEQIATSKDSSNEANQSPNQEIDDCHSPEATQNVNDVETPKCIEDVQNFSIFKHAKSVQDADNDLDKLIVAVKSAKAGKRLGRLRTDSCSTSPVDPGKGISSASPTYSNIYSNGELKSTVHNIEVLASEPSQSVPITWDDPTGRKEREKIAAVNEEIKDIPNVDASQGPTSSKPALLPNTETDDFSPVFLNMTSHADKKFESVKKFMFTSFSEAEKEKLSIIVSELGGLVSESKAFDPSATHLIMGHPLKNLKFLSSVASGKWVLHQSYLNDSADSKCFLPEEAYEWGSEFTESFTKNPSVGMLKASMCARRWRVKLTDQKLSGAFHDWKVVIVADNTDKSNSYVNILQAGGAEIYSLTSIALGDVTHAFVEVNKDTIYQDDLKLLVAHQVKCIKPEYLAYYLIEHPPPSEESYMPLEVKELLSSAVRDCGKRTGQSLEQKCKKRSRLS